MNEYTIVWTVFGSLIGLAIGSLLYMLGGRSHKIIRRLGGSFVIALTVNTSSAVMGNWDIWLLGIFPLLFLGFSMGYAVD